MAMTLRTDEELDRALSALAAEEGTRSSGEPCWTAMRGPGMAPG
jgi:hypothetical protein